jgi:hypothetical protein
MMTGLFNFFRRPPAPSGTAPQLNQELKIARQERALFSRAVQLYIFVHHVSHDALERELQQQFHHTGNAVYSLLINWLRDGKPSLEYMDFLNQKLAELREIPESTFRNNGAEIMPAEIHLLELQEEVRLRFRDEDQEDVIFYLCYFPENGICRHNVTTQS